MAQANKDNQSTSQSPIIWVIIVIIALIMVFVFFSGRSGTTTEQISLGANESIPDFSGEIARKKPELDSELEQEQVAELKTETVIEKAPDLNARDLIRLTREKNRPYPLDELYKQALIEREDNDMENAHLLFFFSAREGYLPSILMMGEMADPLLFNSRNSLLDQADPIQAYKWYRIAIERDNTEAQFKMNALQKWAEKEADTGNKTAQQLLLNF